MNARPYTLYVTWKSAAMAPHIALEEIGAPYTLAHIDFEQPWPEDYLRLNPHRKVPTLVTPEGEVLARVPGEPTDTAWQIVAESLHDPAQS